MAMHQLQHRLRTARGKRTRDEIVEAASRVAGAPDALSVERLQHLETAQQHPPRDGAELRAYAAVLWVPFLDVLKDVGYWPPFVAGGDKAALAQQLLEEAARIGGWRVERGAGVGRDKLVVTL